MELKEVQKQTIDTPIPTMTQEVFGKQVIYLLVLQYKRTSIL